jgi:WD40 repeat protein
MINAESSWYHDYRLKFWSHRNPISNLLRGFVSQSKFSWLIKIWTANIETFINKYEGHKAKVNGLSWSKLDGPKYLASCSNDTTVRIWDLEEVKCMHTLREHRAPVMCVAFDPRNRFLASGDHDGVLIVWTLPAFTVKRIYQCPEGKEIHSW